MALYHKDVFFPAPARNLQFSALLRYSAHARQAATTDQYGHIDLPAVFDSRKAVLVEAEVEGQKVVKAVYRQPYQGKQDLVLVINPEDRLVRTVWINRHGDAHRTLDRSKYAEE